MKTTGRRPRPKTPREIALMVLYHVDTRKAFADLQLNRAFQQDALDPRDAALVTQIVNGTLRWRARLDWIIQRYVKAGFDTLPAWIVNILRMGLYQIYFLDRVPPHAVVDESVKLAKRYGHSGTAGLTNAVLRRALRDGPTAHDPMQHIPDPVEALATAASHPAWIVKRWLERYGQEEAQALLEANNRTPALGLRVNAARSDRETLRRRLEARGIAVESAHYSRSALRAEESFVPRGVPEFDSGLFFVQDESETLVGELLDPQPGETVLDLCAAPGGKATHIQELRRCEGIVIAADVQGSRLVRIPENAARLDLTGIHVVLADGRRLGLRRKVDRVLVDAPCSGLGVLARRADARWRKTPRSLDSLLPLQEELLRAAAAHVRPGGVLVYSVCSNEPEEGIRQIERFLRDHRRFTLEDASRYVPAEVVSEGCLLALPHRHGTDGAFAARLKHQA